MEFFFENPFLVIVLIAVISSFFRKRKDNPETKGRTLTGPGKEQQKRPSTPFDEARDIFKELSRSLQEQQSKPVPRRTSENQYQPERKTKSQPDGLEQPAAAAVHEAAAVSNRKEMITPPVQLKQETTPNKALEVQENQLIDAVIWSEILGSPRAKKPYMSKNLRS